MSHVASIELELKDLDALAAACEPLGLELVREQKTYNWYGYSVGDTPLPVGFKKEELGTCEHAIRAKGTNRHGLNDKRQQYEIGIATRRDGKAGYTLLWDTWRGGNGLVAAVGGDKAQKLVQGYACEVAMRIAKRQGFRIVKKEIRSDGSIAITTQR